MSVFVTGTDTGCGKTLVSCALLECLNGLGVAATGMKPVATGAVRVDGMLRNEDVEALAQASVVKVPPSSLNPYVFEPPCSPHLAASLAGATIELERIVAAYAECSSLAEMVVVEGAGGWCVPLGGGLWIPDLPRALGLPVLLVVGVRLGCINHALLTARAIAAAGQSLAGWVANTVEADLFHADVVIATIAAELPAPLLGVIDWQQQASARTVAPVLLRAARTILDLQATASK